MFTFVVNDTQTAIFLTPVECSQCRFGHLLIGFPNIKIKQLMSSKNQM